MDGTKYNPLFSWDTSIRNVRVSYADELLGGRIPDVKDRIIVRENPDCDVRRVGGLSHWCCGVGFQVSPFLPG